MQNFTSIFIVDFNINEWSSNQCSLVDLVVQFSDDPVVSTGDRDSRFIALHLANVVELLNFITDFYKPEI